MFDLYIKNIMRRARIEEIHSFIVASTAFSLQMCHVGVFFELLSLSGRIISYQPAQYLRALTHSRHDLPFPRLPCRLPSIVVSSVPNIPDGFLIMWPA